MLLLAIKASNNVNHLVAGNATNDLSWLIQLIPIAQQNVLNNNGLNMFGDGWLCFMMLMLLTKLVANDGRRGPRNGWLPQYVWGSVGKAWAAPIGNLHPTRAFSAGTPPEPPKPCSFAQKHTISGGY